MWRLRKYCKKGILSIEGVNEIDIKTSKVTIPYDDEKIIKKVRAKLSKIGYPYISNTNRMIHETKSFVSCASGKMTNESY